jgi:hypothetical protein
MQFNTPCGLRISCWTNPLDSILNFSISSKSILDGLTPQKSSNSSAEYGGILALDSLG